MSLSDGRVFKTKYDACGCVSLPEELLELAGIAPGEPLVIIPEGKGSFRVVSAKLAGIPAGGDADPGGCRLAQR